MAGRGRPSREAVYRRFETAVDELRRLGGLPRPSEAQQIWSDIWHLEAHNSTAIEGNTLILREVEALLDQGRAVGAKVLKDYMEVFGYGEAARWVYGQAVDPGAWTTGELITLTELRNVHHEVMVKAWEVAPHPDATPQESPGSFRRHDIHPFGHGMRPPAWPDVPALVGDWIVRVAEVGHDVASGAIGLRTLPVILAEVHSSFERIHPFIDGNGRTGRLALNLVLIRLGFPPAVIYKRQRDAYLEALDRADHGDPAALAELIARAVIDNLHRFVVPNIAGPARLVPLASLATTELSYEALRQAARRGRLEAEQGSDGVWRSSRKAVDAYLANRFKRDRRPH
ncbi:MAG: filamentation induced by cAMP protein Fic [Acidimicrobiaceae bacterium]|nr:filamentation induced by cAMP protein Fic [Acidimicrobiaceae bacterium]